jgi:hypothetical protein
MTDANMKESIPDTGDDGVRDPLLRDIDPKKLAAKDPSNATSFLFAAAHAREMKSVMLLLKAGARPNNLVLNTEDVTNNKEESFLAALFRRMWHTQGRSRSPSLAQVEDIISTLLRNGARLDSNNGERSALEYACGFPAVGRKHQFLRFLLLHSTAKNVSYKHLEDVIADRYMRHMRTKWRCKELSDYFHTVVCKLAEFRDSCDFDAVDAADDE